MTLVIRTNYERAFERQLPSCCAACLQRPGRDPPRSGRIWHEGAIYRIGGQSYSCPRAALGGGLINRRPTTQIESGAFCFARELSRVPSCDFVSFLVLILLPPRNGASTQKAHSFRPGFDN